MIGHFVFEVVDIDHVGGESAEIDKALVSRPINGAGGVFATAGSDDLAQKNAP